MDFFALLQDKRVSERDTYRRMKRYIEKDPRYTRLTSSQRETFFAEYQKILREEGVVVTSLQKYGSPLARVSAPEVSLQAKAVSSIAVSFALSPFLYRTLQTFAAPSPLVFACHLLAVFCLGFFC